MARIYSDDQLRQAVAAFTTHDTILLAAESLGVTDTTLRRRVAEAAQAGLLEPGNVTTVMPGFEISEVTTGPHGTSVKQRLESGPEFSLEPGQIVKGVSVLTGPDGQERMRWTKTMLAPGEVDYIKVLDQTMEKYAGTSVVVPYNTPAASHFADLLSVYPIADQHHGLLAWGRETGESYDIKIGATRLRECMKDLVRQSPPSETALILNLGDWQHTDDSKNMTPGHGNILDVDSRYYKLLETGILLEMDCIELALRKHKKVIVRNIPGNHDPHASVALTLALKHRYSNDPRVEVICDPSDFFYYEFGKTLIGATHGHKLKAERMAFNMAVTQREAWGRTAYHWMLFGHIHHETVKEVGDVRCESFQTLAAKDAFGASHGYTAGQSLTSVTLHRDRGEIGRHRINILPPDMRG